MARMLIKPGTTWEQARKDAEEAGIVLTKRTHSKGGYVCFASKKLRESLAQLWTLRQLPEKKLLISGKL